MIGDIPKSVTLLNFTTIPQTFESSLVLPAGHKGVDGNVLPGELTVDLTKLAIHRRERMWIAMQNANKGKTVKIREDEQTSPILHPEGVAPGISDGPGQTAESSSIPAGAPAI